MAASGLAFAALNAILKEARADLIAAEVMAWRALTSLPPSALLAWRPGFRVKNRGGMVLRALLGSISMISTVVALKDLSLAQMSLVGKLQPILVAWAAPRVLGQSERVDGGDWALLAMGLFGSLLLLGPTVLDGSSAAWWAINAVLFSTGAHLAIRRLGASEDPATVVFWFQTVAAVLSVGMLVFGSHGPFTSPSERLLPWLLVSGVFATLGQWLMTSAYVHERAAVAAAASYTSPLWAAALDWWLWDLVPGPSALAGGAVILGAGAVLVFRTPAGPDSHDSGQPEHTLRGKDEATNGGPEQEDGGVPLRPGHERSGEGDHHQH